MRRLTGPAAAALLLAALIGLLVYGVTSRGNPHTIDDALARGRSVAAPDRSLPVLAAAGGARSSLAAYRGKVVVLNFWASWCQPCRAETTLLERTQRRITGRRATVLGVDFRDTSPDALAFERRYGITYPSLRDTDGQLAQAYGTEALPETFVIDRAGRIVSLRRGQIDQRYLDQALAQVLGAPA